MANTEYPVLFVGAGPGDPELITLKGKRALEEADLVLYAGSLVNEALLDYCSPGCVRADSSPLSLEEQMALAGVAVLLAASLLSETGDVRMYRNLGLSAVAVAAFVVVASALLDPAERLVFEIAERGLRRP